MREVRIMPVWKRYPTIYEINTWVWLSELGQKYKTNVNLSSVPADEWDAIGNLGFDAVWLMGVWERSPAGTAIANRNNNLLEDFQPGSARFLHRRQRWFTLLCAALCCRSKPRRT